MAQFKPILNNDDHNTNFNDVSNSSQVSNAKNAKNAKTETSENTGYPLVFKIRDKVYHFRKWKVKDLKAYKNIGKDTGVFDKALARQILVYNMIKEPCMFDVPEYLYALIMIREASISDKLTYSFTCDNCKQEYTYVADFAKICTIENNVFKDVKTSNNVISFGALSECSNNNQEYYSLEIANDENDDFTFTDMICHIKSIDGKVLSTTEIIDFMDNLDIDDFENVLIEYTAMKSKLNFVQDIECPHCHNKVHMLFDQLPSFVPDDFINTLESTQANQENT